MTFNPNKINTIRDEKGEGKIKNQKHQRSIEIVQKNSEIFRQYSKGYGIKIVPAREDVGTFYYDLGKKEIGVSDMFFDEGIANPEEKSVFAICHEVEHFQEDIKIINEKPDSNLYKMKGRDLRENYLKRKRDRGFGILDNCIADIVMNKRVINNTNQSMGKVEQDMYKYLFPNNNGEELDLANYRDEKGNIIEQRPRHIQFAEALLLENRSRQTIIEDEVREALNRKIKINNKGEEKTIREIVDMITDINISQANRLFLQEKFIEPIFNELREKDIQDKGKEQQKEQQKQNQEDQGEGQKDGEGNKSEGKEKGKEEKQQGEKLSAEETNEIFDKDYKDAEGKMIPHGGDDKKLQEAIDKYIKENPHLGETKKEKERRESREWKAKIAKELGVQVDDMENYNRLSEWIKIEGLDKKIVDIIKRIVSERKKEKQNPKYPLEEGEEIVDPAMAHIAVKAGNLKPKVWESVEIKENKGKMYGEIEMTFVVDKSGSMQGEKIEAAQKAMTIFMNSQAILQDEIQEADRNDELIKNLKVSWEVYTFEGTQQDFTPIQPLTDKFSLKDRINICAKISYPTGATTDANSLSSIYNTLKNDTEKIEKLRDGELKKVIIVLTDGESGQKGEIKNYIDKLKSLGVQIIAIGITQEANSVFDTYQNANPRLAKEVKDVPEIFAEVIEMEFEDLLAL